MDSLGGVKNGLLVIETDGGIEPVDVLKICGPAFTKLGLSVHRNEIRDAYASNIVQLYQQGWARACDTCLACPPWRYAVAERKHEELARELEILEQTSPDRKRQSKGTVDGA